MYSILFHPLSVYIYIFIYIKIKLFLDRECSRHHRVSSVRVYACYSAWFPLFPYLSFITQFSSTLLPTRLFPGNALTKSGEHRLNSRSVRLLSGPRFLGTGQTLLLSLSHSTCGPPAHCISSAFQNFTTFHHPTATWPQSLPPCLDECSGSYLASPHLPSSSYTPFLASSQSCRLKLDSAVLSFTPSTSCPSHPEQKLSGHPEVSPSLPLHPSVLIFSSNPTFPGPGWAWDRRRWGCRLQKKLALRAMCDTTGNFHRSLLSDSSCCLLFFQILLNFTLPPPLEVAWYSHGGTVRVLL